MQLNPSSLPLSKYQPVLGFEDRAAASPYLSSRGKAALPGTSQEVEQMLC